MLCPKCRKSNPNSAIKCVCGYDFKKPATIEEPVNNNKKNDYDVNPFAPSVSLGSQPKSDTPTSPPSQGFSSDNFGTGQHESKQFHFFGTGSDLFSIYIVNFLLILVTFGVYYFWGKAKIKRYMYSQSDFDGDRFTFHGTGNELFKGGMIAIGFLIIYSLVSEYVNKFITTPAGLIASVLVSIMFLLAITAALVLSRRYYLSRTTWRGIRFTFRGKIKDFTKLVLKGYFLSTITLGLYIPYFINNYQEFMISKSYYGNQNFNYGGSGKDIFKVFLYYFLFMLLVIGGIFALVFLFKEQSLTGLINLPDPLSKILTVIAIILLLAFYFIPLLYFQYWIAKYKWNHTSFLGSNFQLVFSFWQYLKLKIGNALILILTLGLFGMPWVMVRNAKFFTKHLTLEGDLDFEVIRQKMIDTSATGESVMDVFDMDAGLDIGI